MLRGTSAPFQFRMTSPVRSEEHTSELQSQFHLVCRLLLENKDANYEVACWAHARRKVHSRIAHQDRSVVEARRPLRDRRRVPRQACLFDFFYQTGPRQTSTFTHAQMV